MRSESLAYFLEIAEQGSFTSASKRLFISQQGLSKSIKALENDLGCRLFLRDGVQLKLSAAGRALIPHARRCLDDVSALRQAMKPYGRGTALERIVEEERVIVYAAPFITDSLFYLMDADLLCERLSEVSIIERSSDEMLGELERGSEPSLFALCLPVEDVGIIRSMDGVTFHPLATTELLLVGPPRLISSEKGRFSLDRVARMPIVYYNEPTLNRIIDRMFRAHPLENVLAHASSRTHIGRFIQQGKAVTFSDALSRHLTAEDGRVAYAAIEGASQFVVGFAYRKDPGISEQALTYAHAFTECFRTRCAGYLRSHPIPGETEA